MKLLFLSLLSISAIAQTANPTPPASVTITVVVGTKTYSTSLTAGSIAAMNQQVAAANADPTGNVQKYLVMAALAATTLVTYADIGDMIIKHLSATLVAPAVLKFPPTAVTQAASAAATAQAALQSAAASTAMAPVTVTGQ